MYIVKIIILMSLINGAIDAAVPPTHDVAQLAQLIELRHPRV